MPPVRLGVRPSATLISPHSIHGWRPTSVTIQPASTATKGSGTISRSSCR